MLRYSDITPRATYLNRRRFLAAMSGTALIGTTASGAALSAATDQPLHNLFNDTPGPKKTLFGHNNYYEFGTGKPEPAINAPKWKPNPAWPVLIEGDVVKPKTIGLNEILKLAPLEERIYRMRCVEGWSYIVPWVGFPLSALLKQVQPTGRAKYVAFESFYDANVMWSPRKAGIQFPYVEGLRIDEAMHPLTILAVGIYGETLLNQNGAPMRLVVPWKYGFKGIKSITRIRFTDKQPTTTWNREWPEAYGFYSNVNPKHAHPRYDQDTEDRLDGTGLIGQGRKIRTEMFNGYGAQVASLYSGMDLDRNY
jgi:sulfoxide reductase catalytic subunit YedY